MSIWKWFNHCKYLPGFNMPFIAMKLPPWDGNVATLSIPILYPFYQRNSESLLKILHVLSADNQPHPAHCRIYPYMMTSSGDLFFPLITVFFK